MQEPTKFLRIKTQVKLEGELFDSYQLLNISNISSVTINEHRILISCAGEQFGFPTDEYPKLKDFLLNGDDLRNNIEISKAVELEKPKEVVKEIPVMVSVLVSQYLQSDHGQKEIKNIIKNLILQS